MVQDDFVAQEKEKLLDEHAHVTAELGHLREFLQAEVDVEPDEGDAEVFEREKNAALIAVIERRLVDIDTALRLIEKGDYGLCQRCGKPIEIERLEVKPDATMCVACQHEVERLSRRNRPQRQIEW